VTAVEHAADEVEGFATVQGDTLDNPGMIRTP
jgi:hypothetical protein